MGEAVFKNGGRKKAPVARPATREEQIPVVCTRAPQADRDMVGLTGCLTLDYEGEHVFDATFDPWDEAIPNAILPVATLLRSGQNGSDFTLRTEDGFTWAFSEDEEDEDGEEDADSGEGDEDA